MRIRLLALATASLLPILAAVLLAGCSGRPAFDGTVYRDGNVGFRVPPAPEAWRKIKVSDASLAYRDEANDGSVLVNARCSALDQDTPLAALTAHLLIGTTERDIVEQIVEPFDGREAIHTRLIAKLDGVPRAFDVFVLKKDGCIYDFVYVAAPDSIERGAPAFQAFTRGFRTLTGTGAR